METAKLLPYSCVVLVICVAGCIKEIFKRERRASVYKENNPEVSVCKGIVPYSCYCIRLFTSFNQRNIHFLWFEDARARITNRRTNRT